MSRWCALHSDVIVSNSRAGLKAYKVDDHPRALVISNGVDFSRFENLSSAPEGEPTICMVANFSLWKDHATVIRAMPRIRRTIPNAGLLLVGADRGTLRAARRLAGELDVERAVCFITDSLHPEVFVAKSHVGVMASPNESLSNAILEYMALAKPVVATDTCGDTASLLRDTGSGLLVPPADPDTLAQRVVELLLDRQRASRLGEAGRQAVQAFTVQRMVTSYEEVYEELLTARAAAR